MSDEKYCLGCADDVRAEYVWHDGLYPSYVCAEHAKEALPKRGRDRSRELQMEIGGRDRVVSGFAKPIDGGEKVIWKDEVEDA